MPCGEGGGKQGGTPYTNNRIMNSRQPWPKTKVPEPGVLQFVLVLVVVTRACAQHTSSSQSSRHHHILPPMCSELGWMEPS